MEALHPKTRRSYFQFPTRRLLVLTPLLTCATSAFAAPTQAQIDALQKQISVMQKQIEALQDQLRAMQQVPHALAPAPIPAVSPEAQKTELHSPGNEFLRTNSEPGEVALVNQSPTYWQIPGSPTQVRFSGYIRMGAYKDLADNIDSYKFRSGDIHPNGSPLRNQTGNIEEQMRLSRISFDSITPTRLGDLRTVLAVDFAGAEAKTYEAEAIQNNGYHLRLTKRFRELGPVSAFWCSWRIAHRTNLVQFSGRP